MYFLDVSQNAWGLHTQADDTVDTRSRDDDDVDAQWKAQAADLRYKLGLPHAKVVWIDKALLQGVPRTPRYLETISLAWWSLRKVQKNKRTKNWLCDFSQSIIRKPWGQYSTLAQHSLIYSFSLDRALDLEDGV